MIDNIVLAEEMVAAWRRFGTAGFMWRVDFAKAYDSIDWRFLWLPREMGAMGQTLR